MMATSTTTFPLSQDAFSLLKRQLHLNFPRVKSSHLAEAISFGLGFSTHAAFQACLRDTGQPAPSTKFDGNLFAQRLVALGYGVEEGVAVEAADNARVTRQVGSAGPDQGLTPRPALERCRAYGVQIKRNAKAEVFAHHNVAGVVGPCSNEHEAAELACATWDI